MVRKKIGELLMEAGAVTLDAVKQALGSQRSWGAGQRLGQVLVAMGMATSAEVARALAAQSGLPYVELSEIPVAVSALVPIEFQSEHKMVPFRLESDGKIERLCVAVADPSKLTIADELRFTLGTPIQLYIASAADIEAVVMSLRGEVTAEVTPLEIDDDGQELVLETRSSELVPDGWFAVPKRTPLGPFGASGGAAAATADLDQLLGAEAPRPVAAVPPAAPAPAAMNGAAAHATVAPTSGLLDGDHRLFAALERIARGQEPAQILALLMCLLVRKGVVSEAELLDQLRRK
jgi:hypothetical protein